MIFETVINAGLSVFSLLLSVFNLPHIEDTLNIVLEFLDDYIFASFSFINIFVPLDFFVILLPFTVAIILAEDIYSFVMWIVRKIPLAGMS